MKVTYRIVDSEGDAINLSLFSPDVPIDVTTKTVVFDGNGDMIITLEYLHAARRPRSAEAVQETEEA